MRIILIVLALVYHTTVSAQIYSETFTEQNGYGIVGPCATGPVSCTIDSIPAPTGWTISGDASQMLATSDWFLVAIEKLEARDLGAELCFESTIVDISPYSLVDVSFDINEIGDHESSDYVDVFIIVEDDSTLVPAWIGNDSLHTIIGDFPNDDDWGDTSFVYTGISGDSLKLVVCIKNNSGTEIIRLDNILVESADSVSGPPIPPLLISELDCDQSGPDTSEFVELSGPPYHSLDSFVLVLFNGNGDFSYAAYDLDGYALDSAGFFTLCFGNNSSDYCSINVSGSLQNGADGIGLYYYLDADDFPNGTLVHDIKLVDGVRYSTGNDGIDNGLSLLDADPDCQADECQIDENSLGAQAIHSIQRGSWFVGPPTPGQPNTIALPVELINFRVEARNDHALLTWATAWETHNDGFIIEHSTDGLLFSRVGFQKGSHSSRSVKDYVFQHFSHHKGRQYYRLKQLDEDGGYSYSPIRAVTFSYGLVSVYPNLTDDHLYVNWSQNQPANIYIYSMHGELKYTEKNAMTGYSKVSLQFAPSGLYVVVVECDNHSEAFKVLRI